MLTAFPVYPPSWTLPLAALAGALCWRRPVAAAARGRGAVPARVLELLPGCGADRLRPARRDLDLRAGREWGMAPVRAAGGDPADADRHRARRWCWSPRPRRRPRGVRPRPRPVAWSAIVTGALITTHAAARAGRRRQPAGLPDGAVALAGDAAGVDRVIGLRHAAAARWTRAGPPRGQALALWGIGFALVTVGLPAALAQPSGRARTCGMAAAALVAILPAACGGRCAPIPAGPVAGRAAVPRTGPDG